MVFLFFYTYKVGEYGKEENLYFSILENLSVLLI